jgi:hypothetical protein
MPDWARPGQPHLNPDGRLSGSDRGWPTIQDVKPDENDAILIRPGKLDLAEWYRRELILRPETALSDYRSELREFAIRRRAQKAEQQKVGLPDLKATQERIGDQRGAVQEQIEGLEGETPNSVGARLLLEAVFECYFHQPFFSMSEGRAPEIALKFLRPSLTGLIRAHVDEIFDRPNVPAGLLQAVHPSCSEDELAAI